MTLDIRMSGRGALAGLLSGTVGVCVAFLVAGLTGPVGSPVVAVAQAMIDLSPPAVKNFAIREFGSHDKLVLQFGVIIVLALFAAAVGVIAMRQLEYGLAGVGVFALVGMIAAGTRPTGSAVDLVPTLVGAAAAAGTMVLLIRAATARQGASIGADGADTAGPAHASPAHASPADSGPADSGPATAPGAAAAGNDDDDDDGWMLTAAGPPRRRFMALSAAAAGTAGVAFVSGRLLSERASVAAARNSVRLPPANQPAPPIPTGSDLRIPGLSSFITPNSAFYRVDTAIIVPQVAPYGWQLRIHGMVQRELTISYADLIRRPLIEDYITLCCVSNTVGGPYIGNAKWLGASLGALLREAGILRGAEQLVCTSADGFTSGTPVQTAMDGRDALLAIAMNGQPLPVEHGFPVRTVVPGLYGYVSACKWITDINVTTYSANTAYWAQRGWSPQAPVKTECRIDVPTGQGPVKAGSAVIAGVAWAQHKGIDAVEVKVGSGPWRQATLAAVPGIDCWRQWVLHWTATPGTYLIQARATDKTGYTQTALQAPPEPNGASGYPAVQVTVTS